MFHHVYRIVYRPALWIDDMVPGRDGTTEWGCLVCVPRNRIV